MSKQKKLYRISITTDGEKEWYDEPDTRSNIFEEQWWRVYADYAGDVGNKLVYNFNSKKSGSIEKTLIVDDEDHIIVIEVEEYTEKEES